MARKDALLRLHQQLVAKRNFLRRKLDEDADFAPVAVGGDVVDAANDDASSELSSQLCELETEELWQVDRAIQMIREGRYGICEGCDAAIPMERLKALPFTTSCVACQRRAEKRGGSIASERDWESAYEHEGKMNDRELTLGDIDVEVEY